MGCAAVMNHDCYQGRNEIFQTTTQICDRVLLHGVFVVDSISSALASFSRPRLSASEQRRSEHEGSHFRCLYLCKFKSFYYNCISLEERLHLTDISKIFIIRAT